MKLLTQKIKEEIITTTPERKGDYKPLVFMMTDGGPTDDWQTALAELRQIKTGMIVSCAAGDAARIDVLKEISEVVMALKTADTETIKQLKHKETGLPVLQN